MAKLTVKDLIGRKIVAIRCNSQKEVEDGLWNEPGLIIQLDNGASLFPLADEEGNGPGTIVVVHGTDEMIMVPRDSGKVDLV